MLINLMLHRPLHPVTCVYATMHAHPERLILVFWAPLPTPVLPIDIAEVKISDAGTSLRFGVVW